MALKKNKLFFASCIADSEKSTTFASPFEKRASLRGQEFIDKVAFWLSETFSLAGI